ncbi:MAG: exodeoxyribonuclease VII small subunit [Acidobacteriota bacterium]|nr:exodeoxyribonuclease VII small subunit [Acidobacteriota bacterium]
MTELSFEKALAELEKIVEKLEGGELSLDKSLALFEEGVKLARFLRGELEKAEKKIEILLKDEKGQVKAEPFEPPVEEEATSEENKNQGSEEDDDIPF